MSARYWLQCQECHKNWGNRPGSICEDCLGPLGVVYDFEVIREGIGREGIAQRTASLWRYAELLPLPENFDGNFPVGGTPLLKADRLGKRFGLKQLYIKNDSVCFPTLSFKDRVVAVALAQAQEFGFEVVSCSSTGNLANAVAAQAAHYGLQACIFIPADLEPAKIVGTQVYGARLIRVAGNYDQVNRLCSQIADRYHWGFVNINLRPYYAEGSKTVGFEIAEQLGWKLPENVVVPMAGGSLITKIAKAFRELIELGLVEARPVKFFGAQATGCSPISRAVKDGLAEIEPQKPATIARSLAIGSPADAAYALKTIRGSEGWAEDASDAEIVEGMKLLAEMEGVFTETAGGVTAAVTQKLIEQDRITAEETTVVCITGNGLKTTDALTGQFPLEDVIEPRLASFENVYAKKLASVAAGGV
ncbi:MAG: threonine synthase [Candidatus Acidiferrales bacterium]